MSLPTAWLGFVLWAVTPPALPQPPSLDQADYDVAPRRPGRPRASRREPGHETLANLWAVSRRPTERPCDEPREGSFPRGGGWQEHARAALTLRACGRDDLAWEHERFLVVEARLALPPPWREAFVETTIRLQKTLELVPSLATHGTANVAFWRELVVDAVADLGTPSEGRALEGIGLALRALARRGPHEGALAEALEVLANYPPTSALDERLMACARPPFTREQRLALWRLVARRAAQATPASPGVAAFEEGVRRSGAAEAWIALAELWREQGQPLPRVESAWQQLKVASPERLAYWDSIGAERRAAEESEMLALESNSADRRPDSLRRWIKLGDLDRAHAFWDRVLKRSGRDRAALLWLVQAAARLHDPHRLTQAAASLRRLNGRDDDAQVAIGEAWLAVGAPNKAFAAWQVLGRGNANRLATVLLEHDLPEDALAVVARANAAPHQTPPLARLTALALERERRRDEAFHAWWAVHEDARAEEGLQEEAARHLLALIPMVRATSAVDVAMRLEDRVPRAPMADDIALLVRLSRHLGRGDEARAALREGVKTWLDVHHGAIGPGERATLASFSAAFRELRADREEESLWRRLNDASLSPCLWCRWQKALSSLRRGGFADAETDLQIATRMEPDADLDSRLAELAERVGRLDFARWFYERALFARPDDDATRLALSRLYLRTGDRKDAVEILRVAPAPPSDDGLARLPDLARQDLEEARRDQAVWDGSADAPTPMTAADIVSRLYELDKPPAEARGTHEDRRSRLEALHLAGLRGRERRLPFRWPSSLAQADGELVCGLIWYAGNARDPRSVPFLRDVLRSSSALGPLAILALARVAPREAADLSLSLLRDPRQSDPMSAAAALALASAPPEMGEDPAMKALGATVLRREGLAGRAAARALGTRLARLPPGPTREAAQKEVPVSATVEGPGGRPLLRALPWTCESPVPAESLLEVLTETAPCTAAPESRCR